MAKDLGTVVLFLLGLGTMFWVTEFSSYTLVEEWPVAVLATLTAVGTALSAVLLRVRVIPTTVAHALRLAPASLLTVANLVYLLAMSVGQGVSASAPGLGYGFLISLSLGVLAALPRSGDPLERDRRIWVWSGAVIVACTGLANLLLPFFSNEWDGDQFNPAGIVLNVLAVVLLPLAALWHVTAALRPALRTVGLAMLLFTVLNGYNPDQPLFAGQFGTALGVNTSLIVSGLLAFGLPSEKQSGRKFALTSSIVALAAALLFVAPRLLQVPSSWDMAALSLFPMLGAVAALVTFVAVHRARRRARVLPALIVAAVFLAAEATQASTLTWFSSLAMAGVPLALFALTVVSLVRVDRDTGFEILPPRFRLSHGTETTALRSAEAKSYQQSAAVMSALSVLTGPAGVLFSLSAFHRAGQAEQAGLQTTAIRIIAGAGMTVGILSVALWPLWAAALGAS